MDMFLWLVAEGGCLLKVTNYSYGDSYDRWPREGVFLKVTSYSYAYSYGAIPMAIPMVSCLGRVFSSRLPGIHMAIRMELFLCSWIYG